MMRSLVFVAGLLLTPHISIAQSVSGRISSSTIGTEESVSYTLEISDADASDIQTPNPPDAQGLTLISGNPSRSTNMSIINGQVSTSVSYTWHYRPDNEGEAQILETQITVGEQSFTTEPIIITVVPQSQRPQTQSRRRSPFGGFSLFDDPDPVAPPAEITEQDIFIRANQSSPQAFLNEQVTIDYTLYFRPWTSPRNSRQADSWDAEGFWREELDLSDNQNVQVVVENGIQYQTVTIRRVAVFPTRPGELSIDPLSIAAEVRPPSGNPFSSPFFSTPYTTIERASAPINILSKPLPANAPNGFNGAVGQYSLETKLNQTELDVGEALQLSLTISGTGNIALIETPEPDFPGIFEIYDPEVDVSKMTTGNLIAGAKTFTWLLIPRTNGTFQIPNIEFVYFDPSDSDYVVLTSELDPITVTGSSATPVATASTASGFPVDDIAIIKRDSKWISANQSPLHQQKWFYLLLIIPVIGLGVTAIMSRRIRRIETDTAWARNRKAHPMARKHLKNARNLLREDHPDKFYGALEQAILGFLGNRLNISERGLTRMQLISVLSEIGVPDQGQQELVSFLDTCDAARFAPVPPEKSLMHDHLRTAGLILSSLGHEIESIRS
ncbi:MAG: BatD family protein [Bacteroidetes bacterium]|nr:BatD family protein [Bacteroidota bacterium]